MDIRLALMTGIDIPVPELQTAVHQPTIKEISYIGEQEFFIGLQTLSINKNMIKGQGNSLLENNTQYQVIMTPMSILLNKEGQQTIVDENNFEILQEIIKEIFCVNSGPMDQATFNPADEKAREIAEKLMRGRQRVAEQKGETNSSAFGRYLSILTIGLNAMPLSEAMNLTIYQLYDLVERYTLYLNWDLDIRTRLAGGKPDSKPDDWMKNIH